MRQDWGDVPDKEMDDEAGYAEEEDYDEALCTLSFLSTYASGIKPFNHVVLWCEMARPVPTLLCLMY